MELFAVLAAALAWLGRRGTAAVAASVFIGLVLPGALLKPIFTETLFVLLWLAFLRIEPQAFHTHVKRPRLALAAAAWLMVVLPALFGGALLLSGSDARAPALYLALMLQFSAPPIISSPAFAALMRIDAALSLVVLIACSLAAPLTVSMFAALLIGPVLVISPLALAWRLFALLAGAALAAAITRRLVGQTWLDRQQERIDGLNVIALFVFVVALMDGVLAHLIVDPALVIGLLAAAFATALTLGFLTALVFAASGRSAALALAVSAGARNMGLMLAATGGLVPDLTWLYFALAQFPIYLLPHLVKRLVRPTPGELR